MRTAVVQIRSRGWTEYFELAKREKGRAHDLLAIKEISNLCMLNEAGAKSGHCSAALCAGARQYRLFGLVRVYIDRGDKKRQLCELHKVVSTGGPVGIRNSDV